MALSVAQKRARFRQLHQSGNFLLPNPWDVGSAKQLEKLGYQALATTSAGAAWAVGKDDGQLSRAEVLDHLQIMASATDLPVNADFEAGFGETPDEVGESFSLAASTGVAGISIEDFDGDAMLPLAAAVERVRSARLSLDRTAPDVMLVARCDAYFRVKSPDFDDVMRRLLAYSAAGADCLYAPAITDIANISRLVKAIAPKPVNVLLWGDLRVPELVDAGVRRVSVGGSLARIAYQAFETAARNLLDKGSLR